MGLSSSPSRSTGGLQEGEKVGQIRKRVRDLSWKQRKEGHRDDGLEENDEDEEEERKVDDTESKESDGEGEKSQTKAETEGKPPPLPRRTQPTFESFSSPSSGAPAPASSSSPSGASTATPVRKQPTFSLFSSSSSPFSSAAVNVAGPSWLAGKTTSSSTGIKPSTLGTSVGGGESSSSPSPAPSAPQASSSTGSSTPKAAASGNKQLGFGAFATSKPFSSVPSGSPSQAKSPSAVSSTSSRSDRQTSASADAVANGTAEQRDENSKRVAEKEPRSFDDVLREGGGAANDKSTTTSKLSTQLERGEADCELLFLSQRGRRSISSNNDSLIPSSFLILQCGQEKRMKPASTRLVPSCTRWRPTRAGRSGERGRCGAMCQRRMLAQPDSVSRVTPMCKFSRFCLLAYAVSPQSCGPRVC